METLFLNYGLVLLWALIINIWPTADSRSFKRKIFCLIVGLQIIFFHTFINWRDVPDLPIYQAFFSAIANHQSYLINDAVLRHFEPGYILFNRIVAAFTSDFTIFLLVESIIICGSYMWTIYKYSYIPWLSVIIFLATIFTQSLFVLRQHIAIAIILFSVPFIINRKIWGFLLIEALAFSFHSSALIFLPAYWLYNIKLSRGFWFQFACVMAIAVPVFHVLVAYLSSKLGLYEGYLENISEGTNFTPGLISASTLIVCAIALNPSKLDGCLKFQFIMVCIATIINFAGIGLPLIPRLSHYYTIWGILLLANAVNSLKYFPSIIKFCILVCYTLLAYSQYSSPLVKYTLSF